MARAGGKNFFQRAVGDRSEDLSGGLLDAEFFNRAQFGREVEALQALRKPDDMNQFVGEHVKQQAFEVEFFDAGFVIPAFGHAQDAMVLQADAVKVATFDDVCADSFDAVVTEHLGEGLVANLFGREFSKRPHFVMQPLPFARREYVEAADQLHRRFARAFDDP